MRLQKNTDVEHEKNLAPKELNIEKLAHEVLVLSRNTLMVKMRFMDAAFCELKWQAESFFDYATDMRTLWYNPLSVLRKYKQDRNIVARDYLHLVLHCVFRHPSVNPRLDQPCWDLACDIAVENAINELDVSTVDNARERRQGMVIADLKNKTNMLTAEKLYRHMLDKNWSEEQIAKFQELFLADDHTIWYLHEKTEGPLAGYGSGGSGNGDLENLDNLDKESRAACLLQGRGRADAQAEARWQGLAQYMKTDMETFSKQHGDQAGALMQNLGEVTRERYDYGTFLKKFATLGEIMQMNDEEFDYIFYTYGLKLYGNVPLIEPLEYKEVKRIKEFVIAIDTSGSVSGELVQKFLNKTYNIFQESESFFSKINVHIIQCDAELQEDAKITSRHEFDDYLKVMKLHGFGGTDFRPVFEYTNELLRNGEFSNLKGLIYFTDGYGTFPIKKPDYETVFVFIDDHYDIPKVPVWAMKLVLETEDI